MQFFLLTLLYMNVTFNYRLFSVHELWKISCAVHMTVPLAGIVLHPQKFVLISLPMNMCLTEVRDQCQYICFFRNVVKCLEWNIWSRMWKMQKLMLQKMK